MKYFITASLCFAHIIFCCLQANAQKGLPSPVPTTATVATAFPQHEEFHDSLLSRLRVPRAVK